MSVVDRLRAALARAQQAHPDLTAAASEEALVQILYELGGEQLVFPKTTRGRAGRPQISHEVQQAAHRDALAGQPDAVIIATHRISRATLYRLVKRGPSGP